MAIVDFSTTGFYLINEDVPLSNSEVTIGNDSVLCFRGGKLVNDTNPKETITIKGDNITIEAGPFQIFEGSFEFKASDGVSHHNWMMECAYPQWFGAKSCANNIGNPDSTSATDASAAINAAIRLKRVGRVKIPAGIYKITRFINVLPGIILEGETPRFSGNEHYGTVLFPWHDNGSSPVAFSPREQLGEATVPVQISNLNFPPHPNDVNWYNGAGNATPNDCGYMMLIGIDESCTANYRANDKYPNSITYKESSSAQPRVVGTEIRNIAFTSFGNTSKEHRYMRAILMGGAVKLNQVRVYELSQLCCSMTSSDERYVERCSFTPPAFAQASNASAYNWGEYPQKIYAIDLEGGGDAMNVIGNHVATYSEKIGSLKVRSCNGGSITGNILNSDVLIELCRGIDFAGNHMEYGSRLTIASSAVAVRGNCIWRGEKAAITIRRYDKGGFLHYHCSVTLDNNQLFWRSQHYDVNHPDVDPPQAAHFLFPYDVVTDGYASISVNNTFRNCNRGANGEESYFGILMGWLKMKGLQSDPNCLDEEQAYTYEGDDPRNVVGTDYARIPAFEEFNRVSHIASIGSKVVGRNVSTMPTTLVTSEFRTDRNGTTGITPTFTVEKRAQSRAADGWKAVGVRFEYRMWVLADFERRIVLSGPIEKSETYCPAANENLWIRLGHGTITDFSIPAGPYLLYVERTAYDANNESIGLASVTLPVCAASMLWDDGEYLSGFAWTEISQSLASQWASNYNAKVEQVTFNGRNVECLLDEMPNLTPGSNPIPLFNSTEWIPGDVLRAGEGTSPAPHWVMTSHGWRKM